MTPPPLPSRDGKVAQLPSVGRYWLLPLVSSPREGGPTLKDFLVATVPAENLSCQKCAKETRTQNLWAWMREEEGRIRR